MKNLVKNTAAAVGCTALSLGLGLLEANPAQASLIGDDVDVNINLNGEELFGDTVTVPNTSFFEGSVGIPEVDNYSEGDFNIEGAFIEGFVFTDFYSFSEGSSSEGDAPTFDYQWVFNDLNWVDQPNGRITGVEISSEGFFGEGGDFADFADVTFTDDSVTVTYSISPEFSEGGYIETAFGVNLQVEHDVVSTPESSTSLGLAFLSVLGAGVTLKRKFKSSDTIDKIPKL